MTSTDNSALEILRRNIGGCREELGAEANFNKCWKPADVVLWGKLIPADGLGPRCYEHAVFHVDHHALRARAQYALVNLHDLALDLEARGV